MSFGIELQQCRDPPAIRHRAIIDQATSVCLAIYNERKRPNHTVLDEPRTSAARMARATGHAQGSKRGSKAVHKRPAKKARLGQSDSFDAIAALERIRAARLNQADFV